jgi:hypothetical protein
MATKKKLLQAAAGAAGGEGLNVEDVFSTYLYEGNNSTQTITNGIDLSGEGGLVWIKERTAVYGNMSHILTDTENGVNKFLQSDNTQALSTGTNWLTAFNSNGFNVGININFNTADFASWTFRKAPKFFDIVTYNGNGVAGRTVSHNLGAVPAMMIIKRLDSGTDWSVYHKDLDASSPASYYLMLNDTSSRIGPVSSQFNNTAPTATEFTLGAGSYTNNSSGTYVAYLFAHNDGDGEFGPDSDADIIKCGSYTGDGTDQFIDLGFEPQWVMIKNTSTGGTYHDWVIFDNMRKLDASGSGNAPLMANLADSEGGAYASSSYNLVQPTPTGMIVEGTSGPLVVGTNGDTYIYIAIRRGPMAVPTDATDVFAIDTRGTGTQPPAYHSGFPVDMALSKYNAAGWEWLIGSRLTQATTMQTNSTVAESGVAEQVYDYMDGYYNSTNTSTTYLSWMWRRAPNYFDAVAYTGNGTAGRTVSHNLGVAPEMMWVKKRNEAQDWAVYHSGVDATAPEDYFLKLNSTAAAVNSATRWNDNAPTSTVFTVGTSGQTNDSGDTYIAYLFASLDGVSKVGSYTGNGGSQTIDCGFSSGARFVLIKDTSSNGNWTVFDTERGIVSGNDPALYLNSTSAEQTFDDAIDPNSSGFIVNQSSLNLSENGSTYIFYAIA